jgi:4-hydroxy-2-oxoglutarate aldolase
MWSDRCGNVGKLTRIAATVTDPAFEELHPRKDPQTSFLVLGGYADIITSSAFVRGHGAITGLANIAPVCAYLVRSGIYWISHQCALVKLFEISEAAAKDPSRLPEAQQLQGIIARADFTIAKASISGTKYLIDKLHGYGGLPRRPLPPIDLEDAKRLWEHPHVQEIINLERGLGGKTLH